MKKALIIGSEGQDGKLLTSFLKEKDYTITGIDIQKESNCNGITYHQVDLTNTQGLAVFEEFYDEIYYLAAYHHSSQNLEDQNQDIFIEKSYNVNVKPFIGLLNNILQKKFKTKIFYASSSLIFSNNKQIFQSEDSRFAPDCTYSIHKLSSMHFANYFRKNYNAYIVCGILFNHESIYRQDYFLSKKIINDTKKLINGEIDKIIVGDLNAQTDWGYAPDFVEAMWLTLQQINPSDYIIASGQLHSVSDWFDVIFKSLNMDWKKYVVEDKSLIKREKPVLCGNISKIKTIGWRNQTSFEQMVMNIYNNMI